MIIFPAIDLYQGKAVRLEKGDYEKVTVYNENPAMQAQAFVEQGAQFLHLVDLDAARSGVRTNEAAIRAIRQAISIPIQLGGGIRDLEQVDYVLNTLGVNRVIIGTKAIESPAFLTTIIETYGAEALVVSVDVKKGKVATDGWLNVSQMDAYTFLKQLETIGVLYVLVTDISRDGMLNGANFQMYEKISQEVDIHLIVSGGVKDIGDVKKAYASAYYGVITGRALYEGVLDLEEAIQCSQNE